MLTEENDQKLVISLEQNAANCLFHAFEHLERDTAFDLAESIVLAVRAVELYVKAKIVREDSEAIWKNGKTIGFDEALARLRQIKFGKRIKYSDISFIERLKKTRNDLMHHECSENKITVRKYLKKVFLFLERFAEPELRCKLYAKMDDSATSWEIQAIEAYQQEIEECYNNRDAFIQKLNCNAGYILLDCPSCSGHEAIVVPDLTSVSSDEAHCFVCEDVFKLHDCEFCGRALIEDFWDTETERYYAVHEKCWKK